MKEFRNSFSVKVLIECMLLLKCKVTKTKTNNSINMCNVGVPILIYQLSQLLGNTKISICDNQ